MNSDSISFYDLRARGLTKEFPFISHRLHGYKSRIFIRVIRGLFQLSLHFFWKIVARDVVAALVSLMTALAIYQLSACQH